MWWAADATARQSAQTPPPTEERRDSDVSRAHAAFPLPTLVPGSHHYVFVLPGKEEKDEEEERMKETKRKETGETEKETKETQRKRRKEKK